MRKHFKTSVIIPEEVSCKIEAKNIKCTKGELSLERRFEIPKTEVNITDHEIVFSCLKANKKNIAIIKTWVSHFKNMIKGLNELFVYKLEICNVHFPMTVKVDGKTIVISNFLGEKKQRTVTITEGVDVSIKGNQVTVSGHSIEKAGQIAANIEKATRVRKKDRRIFQDGIFIIEKPGGKI